MKVLGLFAFGLDLDRCRELWAPEYRENISEAGTVFGIENRYEDAQLAFGGHHPAVEIKSNPEDQATLSGGWARFALEALISSTLDWEVPYDDPWISAQANWIIPFFSGMDTTGERMRQLAPDACRC